MRTLLRRIKPQHLAVGVIIVTSVMIVIVVACLLAICSCAIDTEATPTESAGTVALQAAEPTQKIEAIPMPESEPELIPLGTYTVTAYCPCVKCCGIWSAEHPSRVGTGYIQKTASGTIPVEGRTIAADPSVLPYGTVIVMDGHEYIVEDRGGAVKGNTIDIFFESHEAALNWGKQTKIIYIKGDN